MDLYTQIVIIKLFTPALILIFLHRSILKKFYNDKKIPLIPTLLVEDTHVADINTKANILNECFAEQCTLLKNNSVLSINQTFQLNHGLLL